MVLGLVNKRHRKKRGSTEVNKPESLILLMLMLYSGEKMISKTLRLHQEGPGLCEKYQPGPVLGNCFK